MVTSEWARDFEQRYERFREQANDMARTRCGQDTAVIVAVLKGVLIGQGLADVVSDDALRDGAQRISAGEHPGF